MEIGIPSTARRRSFSPSAGELNHGSALNYQKILHLGDFSVAAFPACDATLPCPGLKALYC